MIIKYYKNENLKYASRKRYSSLEEFTPSSSEVQKSVLLGDGAKTHIKTSINNLCDYVTIDGTRWFVVSYIYLNGKQISLNLQRDVIGEFGISSCYGKIERGYTDSILKYRKELSLNQILKDRKKLIPDINTYGNYTVDNHTNEMWGIIYFVKPTEINPNTGEPYPEQVNINIPAFLPEVSDLPFKENNLSTVTGYENKSYIEFYLTFTYVLATNANRTIFVKYKVYIDKMDNVRVERENMPDSPYPNQPNPEVNKNACVDISIVPKDTSIDSRNMNIIKSGIDIYDYLDNFIINIFNSYLDNSGYSLPPIVSIGDSVSEYNGVIIKNNDEYYSFNVEDDYESSYGTIPSISDFKSFLANSFNNKTFTTDVITNGGVIPTTRSNVRTSNNIIMKSEFLLKSSIIKNSKITSFADGTITIDTTTQLTDEPYSILAFPLFNCKITRDTNEYNIDKNVAFMIFNTVIQYLSGGEHPYIIDAQIYPYCPNLTNVQSVIQGYPFFSIEKTSFITPSTVQLLPYKDVKKEYIKREYSIVSPEQSNKFSFNFYDYVNIFTSGVDNSKNYTSLNILIKTALKPFAIISSAVLQPKTDNISNPILKGITYSSDLRGCQPSSNGFECSLSSNAFQTYKRENSNYQQIFGLKQEELIQNQKVERQNEKIQGIVNRVSSASMGAIAGASLVSDAGLTGAASAGAKLAAGVAGGAAALAVTDYAYKEQWKINEEQRAYELKLQKQEYELDLGTIKNLPNSINRISSFNEIILQDFGYIIETYECTDYESNIVDNYIEQFGYLIGVIDFVSNYYKKGWFLRSTLIKSNFNTNLHMIAENELMGGIYLQ